MSRPGTLTERVRIEQGTDTTDAGGGQVRVWSTVATVWAEVRPQRGTEADREGQALAVTMYWVTLRRRSDLTADMRLVWTTNGDKVMNIRTLNEPGPRAMYQTLGAEIGVAS